MKVRMVMVLCAFGLLLVPVAAAGAGKEKEPAGQMVDSGAFGVSMNGRRVATETFSVHQQSGGVSIISSQVTADDGSGASQKSTLQITSSGGLVRYEWHELAPGKVELYVVPDNEFLKEYVTQNPGEKPAEQPFLMPSTSIVLDNNFFVHREILAWRYLASSCTPEGARMRCGPAQFGVIVPQERISTRISVQPVGEEKIAIRGAQRQLLRINVKSDDEEWALWLDPLDHYKLVRVTRSGNNMEVVRD